MSVECGYCGLEDRTPSGICRPCRNSRARKHYAATRGDGKVQARSREADAAQREWFNTLKEKPCADCGVQYPPYVMDFDHRPDEIKLFGLAANWRLAREKIVAEAAKCDVVCSNCHRERTHARRYAKEF